MKANHRKSICKKILTTWNSDIYHYNIAKSVYMESNRKHVSCKLSMQQVILSSWEHLTMGVQRGRELKT